MGAVLLAIAGIWLSMRAIDWYMANTPKTPPQAIFVLGGALEREAYATELAQQHPDLEVWISSGSNEEYALWLFESAGIDLHRLHLDYRARDTVTNFTSMVDVLKAQGIHSVYLVTSDYHMRRACLIAWIVFGSRGIDFHPLAVETTQPAEPWEKNLRDGTRAVLWLATGRTGASLASSRHNLNFLDKYSKRP
ncbi:MAG: YdcF family protein [Coleofasciculaceae cyanobacterium SM2_3_26]|nr:YdcF family protein [Coleofasciculaceae cyanobacterium SM2_3_26]